jgi:hypothetical protein
MRGVRFASHLNVCRQQDTFILNEFKIMNDMGDYPYLRIRVKWRVGPFEVLYFVEPPRMFWHVACCVFPWLVQAVARRVAENRNRANAVSRNINIKTRQGKLRSVGNGGRQCVKQRAASD